MNAAIETQWVDQGLIEVPAYGRIHSPEAIAILAKDMAKNGQLQNAVVVKSDGGRYELVIGKGRLEAARSLGWEKIRVDVKEGLSQIQKLAMIAAENEAREDACPFYTAMLYAQIIHAGGLTQDDLATEIGRDRSYVSLYMTLTKVPQEIWNDHQAQLTSLRVCLEIARAKDPEHQKKLVEAAVANGLGSSAVKKLAQRLAEGNQGKEGEESKAGAESKPAFAFAWKGERLSIKGQVDKATFNRDAHLAAYTAALDQFLTAHPVPGLEVMAA